MIDFLGNEVGLGDLIFYSTTGRYPESRLARITRMTEKSIFVEVIKHNRPFPIPKGEVVVRNDFVLIQKYLAPGLRYL